MQNRYKMTYVLAEGNKKNDVIRLYDNQTATEQVYTFAGYLGSGAYGQVSKFTCNGESIALKTPLDGCQKLAKGVTFAQAEKLTAREFEFLQKSYPEAGPYVLRHLHDKQSDGLYYSYLMVMPFVPGKDLDKVFAAEKKPHMLALIILRVLQELHRLHKEPRVIHGDIRPGNLLIEKKNSDFNVRFLDTFFSYDVDGVATTYTGRIDFYRFSTPERMNAGVPADPAQDVYSIARTIKYALSDDGVSLESLRVLYTEFPAVDAFLQDGSRMKPGDRPKLADVIEGLSGEIDAYKKAHRLKRGTAAKPKQHAARMFQPKPVKKKQKKQVEQPAVVEHRYHLRSNRGK